MNYKDKVDNTYSENHKRLEENKAKGGKQNFNTHENIGAENI